MLKTGSGRSKVIHEFWIPNRTACALSCAPSFARIFVIWFLTVRSEMNSRLAISLLALPSATCDRIVSSRWVSGHEVGSEFEAPDWAKTW